MQSSHLDELHQLDFYLPDHVFWNFRKAQGITHVPTIELIPHPAKAFVDDGSGVF
jgi:hypothetical protein